MRLFASFENYSGAPSPNPPTREGVHSLPSMYSLVRPLAAALDVLGPMLQNSTSAQYACMHGPGKSLQIKQQFEVT